MSTPLVFGDEQREALQALRERATLRPVDIVTLMAKMGDTAYKATHMAQMEEQSIEIPFGFLVTYSVEIQSKAGPCRHMSMSSPVRGRLPSIEAVKMVAAALGFVGIFEHCNVWIEDLQRGEGRNNAINIVQPLSVTDPGVQRQN